MTDNIYFDKYEKLILQVLVKERRALSILELSNITGISRKKVSDTLKTLKNKEFAIEVIEDDN